MLYAQATPKVSPAERRIGPSQMASNEGQN
jgi:hypothetical protein